MGGGQYGQSGDRSSQSFSSYSCAHGDDWPRMTEDNELIRRAPVTDRGSIPTDLISFPIERYRRPNRIGFAVLPARLSSNAVLET